MITGAHVILYSKDAAADRAFLKDVIGLPHVDDGQGWLIFGLPASEIAAHPDEKGDRHRVYFIVADIEAFVASMGEHGVSVTEVSDQGWGLVVDVTLPGGGTIGVYEARHARPPSA